ncbi:MAG: hypothetical protein IKR33_08610 [Bacteroidales bacterium]|nr:hypothetical protein [Bacteroidales bacterium]
MANIWKAQSKVNNKIKRNNHDLSKKSNISLKFGTLYPVFCKKVFPGDSFSIDTAFNLKLQPVIFPVQTKMRAHMHYFYVRNKNLWSGWEDWITGLRTNEETPHPYLNVRDEDIKTSSIHDFLGVPTTVISNSVQFFNQEIDQTNILYLPSDYRLSDFVNSDLNLLNDYSDGVQAVFLPTTEVSYNFHNTKKLVIRLPKNNWYINVNTGVGVPLGYFNLVADGYPAHSDILRSILETDVEFSASTQDGTRIVERVLTDSEFNRLKEYTDNGYLITPTLSIVTNTGSQGSQVSIPTPNVGVSFALQDVYPYDQFGISLFSRELHLNALPYRAYESIYNAFYRNTQVDPLIINGRTEYNKFVENMGDGADNFNYHLHQRNYELDFLTSALPSPQQCVAPLVGMTSLGDITIEDENGITTAKATVGDDGTITDVVVTSPAASIEHQRVAMSLAQFGMNIQDFRNANAYLRLLETSIRKGYRYIENILGHWGVAPKHNTLDMPEFIGGFSRDVQVSTVVSSADTLGSDGLSLGDYGGFAQLVGGSKSPVRHFCDDHGFIIGILSVVPTPCYSQLLPKQMIAPTSYLDYYFPEFDQIGYQPITYKEVAPIQSFLDSLTDPNKRLEDTFGYQRPNYDLVGDVDEVHGLFRTEFRNYVINRIFDTRPELGHDFISINPSEINQIFVNTNPDDDCIIGEIGFAVHTKRPVSRVVIPGLGH